jgi:hypothetical protein
VDAASQTVLNIGSASRPITSLIGNVILHTGIRVDIELDLADRGSQTLVVLAGIFVIGVVLGVAGRC